jgi:hypothetical protein
VQALEAEAAVLRAEVKSAQTLVLRDELRSRRRVLRRLGYLTPDGLVTPKGGSAPVPLRVLMLHCTAGDALVSDCAAMTWLRLRRLGAHASARFAGDARCFTQEIREMVKPK